MTIEADPTLLELATNTLRFIDGSDPVADLKHMEAALVAAYSKGRDANAEVEQLKGFLKIDGEVLTNQIDQNRDAIFDIDRLEKDNAQLQRELAGVAEQMAKLKAENERLRQPRVDLVIAPTPGPLPIGDDIVFWDDDEPAPTKDGE